MFKTKRSGSCQGEGIEKLPDQKMSQYESAPAHPESRKGGMKRSCGGGVYGPVLSATGDPSPKMEIGPRALKCTRSQLRTEIST